MDTDMDITMVTAAPIAGVITTVTAMECIQAAAQDTGQDTLPDATTMPMIIMFIRAGIQG